MGLRRVIVLGHVGHHSGQAIVVEAEFIKIVGHSPHLERPEEFRAALLELIEG